MHNSEADSVKKDLSRRSFLKVLTAASASMTIAPPAGAAARSHFEGIGVPLRGPDGKVIVFHPPMASGIPLGGMGAGTFEIRADGGMYDWQIFKTGPEGVRIAPLGRRQSIWGK